MRATQLVTSLGCCGRRRFWAQPGNFEQLKKQFSLTVCERKEWCFQVRLKRYYYAETSHTKISFQ